MVQRSVQTSIGFDPDWLTRVHVNLRATERQAADLSAAALTVAPFAHYTRLQWALKILSLIDLTTLAGDDTRSNVQRLCQQAAHPLGAVQLQRLDRVAAPNGAEPSSIPPHTAAVCVYPSRVADAHQMLERMLPPTVDGGSRSHQRIQIAAVATGFPSGAYSLRSRLAEIEYALSAGATEIDIVLDRALVLTGQWPLLYDELQQMRTVCGLRAQLKAILAVGECGSLENVHRAAMVAMMAGADFIKTSTGKEAVNATLPVGLVMVRAIAEFRRRTGGQCVGLKPAGGVRTFDEAMAWMRLVANTLGGDWLRAERFRFGASGLLDNVVEVVRKELGGLAVDRKAGAKETAAAGY